MANRTLKMLPALVIAAVVASSASAMFMRPQAAPVDRLITNTEAYIKEHPKDASGYYTLARIHYLAFSRKAESIGGFPGDAGSLPTVASDQMQGATPQDGAKAPTDEQLTAHAKAAMENYNKCIQMDPKNGLNYLGLASLLDAVADSPTTAVALAPMFGATTTQPAAVAAHAELFKALRSTTYKDRADAADKLRSELPGITPELIKQWGVETDMEAKKLLGGLIGDALRVAAMDFYAKAFDLSVAEDLQIRNKPISGLNSLVSYEAATRYAELAKNVPAAAKADETTKMADAKKQLDGKRMGPITPIIFSMNAGARLEDLLAPGMLTFDLDGTSRGMNWQWVKPEACILAWDPNHTGRITSGWQLFGSVTFNMIWSDGYRALDALDDNRDGVLSGDELKGLVIWNDRNGNGVCDPGEVTPIEQTGIKSIKVHPDVPTSGDERVVPTAERGVMLKSGAALPTWDWMLTPTRELYGEASFSRAN